MPSPRAAAESLVWGLVFFSPLALASVPAWAVAAGGAVSIGALVASVLAARRSRVAFQVPLLGKVFIGALIAIGLQLVPLPPVLIGLLSPQAKDLFEFVLAPIGHYPAWRPLSLDPPATAMAFARFGTILCAYLAACQLVRSRAERRRLGLAIASSGTALAIIGLTHRLLGATVLFGVYHYKTGAPPLVTSFANPNHLASLLALGALVSLGLAIRSENRQHTMLLGGAYLIQAAGVFLSFSRAGIVAFLVAHVVFVGFVLARKPEDGRAAPSRIHLLLRPIAAAAALAVVAYLAWSDLARRMASVDAIDKIKETKIALIPSFLPLMREFWLTGVGRGSFESAFGRFQPIAVDTRFTHPENWVFQQLCELGLLAGGLFCVACIWSWGRVAIKRPESSTVVGALAGVFAVALHDLADFGLEFGGVAIPVAIALALVTADDLGPRWINRPAIGHLARAAIVATVIALLPCALWSTRHSLESDSRVLLEVEHQPQAAEVLAEQIAPSHPADYYVQLVPALAWASQRPLRPDKVLLWANRAMYLNPSASWAHRLAARCLLALGRSKQARIEYRLAFPGLDRSKEIVEEIVGVFHRPEELVDAVPETPPAIRVLQSVLAARKDYPLIRAVALVYVARQGDDAAVLVTAAAAARQEGLPEEALSLAKRAISSEPDSVSAAIEVAQALRARGDLQAASAALDVQLLKHPADAALLSLQANYLVQLHRPERAHELIRRLFPLAASNAARAGVFMAEGDAYVAEEKMLRGVDSYRSAIRVAPQSRDARWRLVRLLEQQGRFGEALAELNGLAGVTDTPELATVEAERKTIRTRLETLAGGP